MDESTRREIRKALSMANRVVFLGGAGVSTASGIPDFRSPKGLYHIHSKYGVPYEQMLSASYFYAHPETFYEFYWECMVNPNAKPNKAHLALAKYQKNHNLIIITQNIDGLDVAAGSKPVLEVHGSVGSYHCLRCGKHYRLDQIQPHGVPHCECGDILKPDVTLYEEALDEDTLLNAIAAVRMADFLIIGGTSMNVYPIAGIVDYFSGGKQLIINLEPTRYDRYCDYVIHEDIGETLEALLGD